MNLRHLLYFLKLLNQGEKTIKYNQTINWYHISPKYPQNVLSLSVLNEHAQLKLFQLIILDTSVIFKC